MGLGERNCSAIWIELLHTLVAYRLMIAVAPVSTYGIRSSIDAIGKESRAAWRAQHVVMATPWDYLFPSEFPRLTGRFPPKAKELSGFRADLLA